MNDTTGGYSEPKLQSACCEAMRVNSTPTCSIHPDPMDCPDVLVLWCPTRGPGIPVRDGGSAICIIDYCPWCGTKLKERDDA